MNMRTIGNTSDRSSGNLRMKQSLLNANQSIMPIVGACAVRSGLNDKLLSN